MDWIKHFLDQQYWIHVFERFSLFAPLMGILLVMIEAFIPILPLYVLVSINVMAFGFWQGYILSWVGNCGGTIIVFLLIRRFGAERFQRKIQKSRRIKNIFLWIERHGFLPVFILLSFPFTPSSVISGLSALSKVETRVFVFAILFGKLLMILSLSFIGFNISEFFTKPIRSSLFILMTLAVSGIGKIVIKKYEKHLDKMHHKI